MIEPPGKAGDAAHHLEPAEGRERAVDGKRELIENEVEVERLVPRQQQGDDRLLLGIERVECPGPLPSPSGRPMLQCLAHFFEQLLEHVLRAGDEPGAVPQECVNSLASGRADRTGHGEDLTVLLEREPRGDERAALRRRFHHERSQSETGDDAVPPGKVPRVRRLVEAELRDDGAPLGDSRRELSMFGGVDFVEARAEDGDRAARGLEGSLVPRGIDASGEAAHDGEPERREIPRKPPGGVSPVWSGAAGAHDGERERVLTQKLSHDGQRDRRIRYRREKRRVVRLAQDQEPVTPQGHSRESRFRLPSEWAIRVHSEPPQGLWIALLFLQDGEPIAERNLLCSGEKPRMEPGHTREDEIGDPFPPSRRPLFSLLAPLGGVGYHTHAAAITIVMEPHFRRVHGGEVVLSSSKSPFATSLTLLAILLASSSALAEEAEEKRAEDAKEQVAFGIQVAQLGLWKEAVYRWSRAVELDPESARARNNLAVAHEQMGEFDQANAQYERALELEPNNIYIRQNYELFREAYERKKRTDRRSGPN